MSRGGGLIEALHFSFVQLLRPMDRVYICDMWHHSPQMNYPTVLALPKADIHVHAESLARLAQVVALRRALETYDHRPAIKQIMQELPPGIARLVALDRALVGDGISRTGIGNIEALDDQPDFVEARFELMMEEAASEGALLLEIRIGGLGPSYPHLMTSFRGAETRVRRRHPEFHAEPIIAWFTRRPEAEVNRTLEMAPEGIAGVDFYADNEGEDLTTICRWAERASAAGLGITCHVGEFDSSKFRDALAIPGLTRLGHAVHATEVPGILDEIRDRRIVVEAALTSNVVLGAVSSYEAHPVRRFQDAGVRMTLATDDPLRVDTTIAREYGIAAKLGFTRGELMMFTRNGIEASFTTPERKLKLLAALDAADGEGRRSR